MADAPSFRISMRSIGSRRDRVEVDERVLQVLREAVARGAAAVQQHQGGLLAEAAQRDAGCARARSCWRSSRCSCRPGSAGSSLRTSAIVGWPERSIWSRVMISTGATVSWSVRRMLEPVMVTRSSDCACGWACCAATGVSPAEPSAAKTARATGEYRYFMKVPPRLGSTKGVCGRLSPGPQMGGIFGHKRAVVRERHPKALGDVADCC